MIRQIDVPDEQWRSGDLSAVRNWFEYLAGHPELAREWPGTVLLTFADVDSDEPILVPEIRTFVAGVHEEFPHALYFLSPEPLAGAVFQLVVALSEEGDLTIGPPIHTRITPAVQARILFAVTAAATFAVTMGDDWEAAVSGHAEQVGGREFLDALRNFFEEVRF